ncbi:hypothetical protein HZS_1771, partial [Henneguya salminicola]
VMVSYQLKILTTALMSVLLLNRRLSARQWFSLCILFSGVVLVNLSSEKETPIKETGKTEDTSSSSKFIGLLSVVISCITSAFSGVYCEKLIKKENSKILIINIQMSLIGIFLSAISGLASNYDRIIEKGFFIGFNRYVWIYIFLQAFGGLLISVVVKYADNILKGFSTSIAIILSSILSYFLFSFQITLSFSVGTAFVISSVIMYAYG